MTTPSDKPLLRLLQARYLYCLARKQQRDRILSNRFDTRDEELVAEAHRAYTHAREAITRPKKEVTF